MGIPQKHLANGEQVVLHLRTHPKALFWPTVLLALLLAAGLVGAWLTPEGGARTWVWLVIAVIVLGLALWLFVLPLLRWLSTTYTITTRRLITRAGLLNRTGHDIPLYRIADVQFEKSLLDRVFGCGTLLISNAAEHGGVRLEDVPQVESVQVQLNTLLHRMDDGTDDDGARTPGDRRRR